MHASSLRRLGPRSLALGVLLLCACKDPVLEGVEVPPMDHEHWEPVLLREAHDVDILFVVDDTSSMATAQAARSDFCSDAGFNLELRFVRREGVALPEGSAILFDCELSDEKALDCPGLP